MLAQAGIASGAVSEQFYSLMLASAIITMLLTPFSMNLVGRFYRTPEWVPRMPLMHSNRRAPGHGSGPVSGSDRVVPAGYGRIGENMAQGLQDAGIPFTIIDVDPERLNAARKLGRSCLHGDASNPVVLTTARITDAEVLAATFPDPVAVINTVKTALELNPRLKVVARVHRAREAKSLAGLSGVELVSPEYEASLEFVRRILKASGSQQSEIQNTMPKVEEDEEFVEFAADDEH